MVDTVTVPAELFEVAMRLAHHMANVAAAEDRVALWDVECNVGYMSSTIDNARNVMAEWESDALPSDLCARWNELRAKYGYGDMMDA